MAYVLAYGREIESSARRAERMDIDAKLEAWRLACRERDKEQFAEIRRAAMLEVVARLTEFVEIESVFADVAVCQTEAVVGKAELVAELQRIEAEALEGKT